ncbi:amidase [Hylemonella gracilis str. Niagara R]|uniref:Amidase n=1 Tax=Hylemonella gracilis str. Niagara R TaxID=1458275 RepID=A0A016XHH5_9BURK|nr:amidase [Hylemonella gracilis]EYC51002.1 amidase [Hylemonella gracilis str. Niagara R]
MTKHQAHDLARHPLPDLHVVRKQLSTGASTAVAQMELAIEATGSPSCKQVFIQTDVALTRRQASTSRPGSPLAGLAVSVKDLFDVAGQTTTAGSLVLHQAPAATQDSVAVARLRAAGAAFIGRTNMSEFAFSGVGINPHHGTPANPAYLDQPRIPGGSSSGAAVSVATGAAFIGLGSDTGGSIRIPAALQGLVGFKNTARLVPTEGALPLSTTLDTACAITRSVRDAILAHEILSARTVPRHPKPLKDCRFAVPRTLMLDVLEAPVAQAFDHALRTLRDRGARIEEIALPELNELAGINATGGFSAAESHAWHRKLLHDHGDAYDPRVKLRIERGASMSAWQYIELIQARHDWITRMTRAITDYDALLSPTVPMLAPPIAQVAPGAQRDDAFFRVNALLLRNPSVVNMLDGCAITLPCQTQGEAPVGLMLWHGALHDDSLLNLALQLESLL